MRQKFKKISAIAASVLMVGMSIGGAFAASTVSFPNSFTGSDVAIVYGASAASSDTTASNAIDAYLTPKMSKTSGTSVTAGDIKVTDDELTLGGDIVVTGGKILSTFKNNKLSSLAKGKFSWDDGSGSEEYDYHEELLIEGGNMNLLTTLDDPKLEGVALSNEQALEYHYVFDDALDYSKIGNGDADTFYLTLMGEEYEIEKVDTATNSITVTTSKQLSLGKGETYTVEGKTLTVKNVFENSVEVSVDGVTEVVTNNNSKKVNGIRVEVEDIGYHSNSPETSVAILRIGKDISKTYKSEEAFIGQDEDNSLWVWDINLTAGGKADDYIGIKYNANIDDSATDKGDSIKYVGEGYVFPNNYAAVTLDKITDAKYQDLKIYFEDSVNLYADENNSTAFAKNKPVLVIEGEKSDSITVGGKETSTMYVYYDNESKKFQTFYKDVTGEHTPTNYMRLANSTTALGNTNDGDLTSEKIASVEIGDTNLDINITVSATKGSLIISNTEFADSKVTFALGGDAFNVTAAPRTGKLEYFGNEKGSSEAEASSEVTFASKNVSGKKYSYMDTYGMYLSRNSTVDEQFDADKVVLSVPEEQVYAQVSVSMGATTSSSTSGAQVVVLKDTEVSSTESRNLVVVGGSCINTVAAKLLGSSTPVCADAFTTKTGVKSGEFLIQNFNSPYASEKYAILVAGYEAADTTKAATYLTTDADKLDLTVGKSNKISSSTVVTTTSQ